MKIRPNVIMFAILINFILISITFASPMSDHKKIKGEILDQIKLNDEIINHSIKRDLITCDVPVFLKTNSDFYNKSTGQLKLKEVKRLLRKLEFQMVARYGKEDLENGLSDINSAKFKFDEFDIIYFTIRTYINCIENLMNDSQ